MKWSIHAEGVLRVPRVVSRRMMLICGTRSIVLLRTMSPDRTSVATKPAIMPFNAFDITTSQISGCVYRKFDSGYAAYYNESRTEYHVACASEDLQKIGLQATC